MIAALFIESGGCYTDLPNVDAWDITRDARQYAGPHPVVAHPPCQLWGIFAPINFKRWGGEHNRPGNDGGCFAHALATVRRCGGVLEHPRSSKAWPAHGLQRPVFGQWTGGPREWVTEVYQSTYGHQANKATWLLYVGDSKPADLDWRYVEGSHKIGHDWEGRARSERKPVLRGHAASATPPAFRDVLIALAQQSQLAP